MSKRKRRIGALFLTAALIVSQIGTAASAQEFTAKTAGGLCEHHKSHIDCGYVEAVEGHPCEHEHTAECYTDELICGHDPVFEQSATGSDAVHRHGPECYKPDCPHERGEHTVNGGLGHDGDCGYAEAVKGSPCGYICEVCGGKNEITNGNGLAGAEDGDAVFHITAFDELNGKVKLQQVPLKTPKKNLILPDTLQVSGYRTNADSDGDGGDGDGSQEGAGSTQSVSEQVTIEGVTWELTGEKDSPTEYEEGRKTPCIYYFRAVLPEGYVTDMDLPEIKVWYGIASRAGGEISGNGYTFDANGGILIINSNDGTTNWREDIRFTPADVREVELADEPSLTEIRNGAFKGCVNMEWLIPFKETPPQLSDPDAFEDCPDLYILVPHKNSDKVGDKNSNYHKDTEWSKYEDRFISGSCLTGLTVSSGDFEKPFSPRDTVIKITVPSDVEEITLTPTSYRDADIKMKLLSGGESVNKFPLVSGIESRSFKLGSRNTTSNFHLYIAAVNGEADNGRLGNRPHVEIHVHRESAPRPITINQGASITIPAPVAYEIAKTGVLYENDQYTIEISKGFGWEPRPRYGTEFEPNKEYSVDIELKPKTGYTIDGMQQGLFAVNGEVKEFQKPTPDWPRGVLTLTFPKTEKAPIGLKSLRVTPPASGAILTQNSLSSSQYNATIAWTPAIAVGEKFAPGTVYTAVITVTPTEDYTLKGIPKNSFKVYGAESVSNEADSGIVTAVFPRTTAPVSIQDIQGVTPPSAGKPPVKYTTDTTQYTGVVTWEPEIPYGGTFEADTEYTATISLMGMQGYLFQGVPENFFRVAGAAEVKNEANSGIVTAKFPRTESIVSQGTIEGVTVPVYGETPVREIKETEEYKGTVQWTPEVAPGESFDEETEYTATITLTAKDGYTLNGVPEDFFNVPGAVGKVTNQKGSGVITAKFPRTDAAPVYSIKADITEIDFGSVTEGYEALEAKIITIQNTGNQSVTLNQPAAVSYEVGKLSQTDMAPGSSSSFTVRPFTGLKAGKYKEKIVMNGSGNTSITVELAFTVTEKMVYPVTITIEGNGTAQADKVSASEGEKITLTAVADKGYHFKEWKVVSGGISIVDNGFLMGTAPVELKAVFEKDSDSTDEDSSETVSYILNGTWVRTEDGIWKFRLTDRSYAKNRWGLINGLWYYFDADGHMLTGWYYDLYYQKWFYLDASGAMVVGWRQIDGKWYYFNPVSNGQRGAMLTDAWIDGWYVDRNGVCR